MKKYAVLGMDVEEWFHLDYFLDEKCDVSQSTLDGIEIYLNLLRKYDIKTTFFVVGEIVEKIQDILKRIIDEGHEIALHSYHHRRPLSMKIDEFIEDTRKSVEIIKNTLNYEVKGFRAPCFSLDRERLDILRSFGLRYDASKINFGNHKLYGNLQVDDFQKLGEDIFKKHDFYEFETSTVELFGKNIPVSGGGYLRILPWKFTEFLINIFLKTKKNYFFYIHPFEFSRNYNIVIPKNTETITKFRFNHGRRTVEKKMHRLIKILEKNSFEFVKFEDLID